MMRIALVITQVSLAETLARQVTDETKEDLKKMVQTCVRDAHELLAAVTGASLEPVIRVVEGGFGRALGEMRRLGEVVKEESAVEDLIRRSESLIGLGR